jgi:small subunit ribosomal protein S6
MKQKLNNYEFVCIFTQDTTEQIVRSTVSEYTQKIKEVGGEVTKTEFCGMRTFAYPIDKKKKGYYILLNLKLPPEFVKKFDVFLKNDSKVVRFLLLSVDELDAKPSELLQQRHNLDTVYKAQIRSGKIYQQQPETA